MRTRSGRYKRKTGTAGLINEYGDDMQPGDIVHSARTTAPVGYLIANGAAVSRATYGNLFAALGTAYGAGDGATTFNLPDLRGEFIRGADQGRGVDTGRAVGSGQLDALQKFDLSSMNGVTAGDTQASVLKSQQNVVYNVGTAAGGTGPIIYNATSGMSPIVPVNARVSTTETRPRNVALLPLIKY